MKSISKDMEKVYKLYLETLDPMIMVLSTCQVENILDTLYGKADLDKIIHSKVNI